MVFISDVVAQSRLCIQEIHTFGSNMDDVDAKGKPSSIGSIKEDEEGYYKKYFESGQTEINNNIFCLTHPST